MCGRYALHSNQTEIEGFFSVQSDNESLFIPQYNIAPGSENPVVLTPKPGLTGIGALKWGLIPSWAKEPSIGFKLFNARSETLSEKPSFKEAFKYRRCIIPANGFFEWQALGKLKIPFYIRCLDQPLFGMAGLYETWRNPETNKLLYSYTIITTEANELIRPLHERMPVILTPKHFQLWLDPTQQDTQLLSRLLKTYSYEEMGVYRVSTEVNSTKNSYPNLIHPVDA